METKETINLNKLEAKEGVLLIQSQELETPKVYDEHAVEIKGTISAPGNFIEKRKDQDEVLRANVQYSFRDLYIRLQTKENKKTLGYVIEGKLTQNPKIKELGVNTKQIFGVKALGDLLKFNKFFFADKEQHMTIISNLQRFRVDAQTQIEAADDNRGNKKEFFEVKNNSNVDLNFTLQMPIFIGEESKKFKVEICYNVREKNIEVWLESSELQELIDSEAEAIIKNQLSRFPEQIVLIEQ